jgi:pimeloyl-ACP methyl ester carboxylesterase
MEATNVVVGIVAFVAVAGYTVLAWLRRGRDPTSLDDQSIFLPAPPPGMTAATAAMIIDRDPRTAFMAALLDLASRDEIAFVVEGQQRGVDLIGLAIHGGESTDPRVRLNRRNPIGEAEEWLLGELKAYVERQLLPNVGHFLPREAPDAVVAAVRTLTR